MSEPAVVTPLASRRRNSVDAAPAPLPQIGLLHGLRGDDLDGIAPLFERVELDLGDVLWRQGTPCKGLCVLLAGQVQVCRRLPGDRELELARLGPGEVMGEIPLLGRGAHSATVRAVERCSLWFLSRDEFEARTISGDPGALELRRRIVAIACSRLRRAYTALAATFGPAHRTKPATPGASQLAESHPTAMPPREYLSRLALFGGLEPAFVTEIVDRATVLSVPRGHVLQAEGTEPRCCYITVNGAVEDTVRRCDTTLRVGFTGPGHAFGYLGLLDGRPAPATSVTRERSVLLALEPDVFSTLMHARGAQSRAFVAAIEADLIGSLQTAERTRSHLATARPA